MSFLLKDLSSMSLPQRGPPWPSSLKCPLTLIFPRGFLSDHNIRQHGIYFFYCCCLPNLNVSPPGRGLCLVPAIIPGPAQRRCPINAPSGSVMLTSSESPCRWFLNGRWQKVGWGTASAFSLDMLPSVYIKKVQTHLAAAAVPQTQSYSRPSL